MYEVSPPAEGTAEPSRTGNGLSGQGGVRRRENKERGGQKERRTGRRMEWEGGGREGRKGREGRRE